MASKWAKRPRAGEPEGLLCRSSRSSCGATRTEDRRSSRSRGNHVPASRVSSACPLHGGLRARLGRGARWKPVGQPGIFAPETRSTSNPQGSRRPPKGGTAPREGKALKGESQGRSWSGNRLRKLRGVATTELQERGNPTLQESARLKPPRGNGSPVESAGAPRAPQGERGELVSSVEWTKPEGGTGRGCGNSRLPRSVEPVVAETGHPESNVVGTKNPRRGGPERRRKPAIRRRKPLGQCTPVVL